MNRENSGSDWPVRPGHPLRLRKRWPRVRNKDGQVVWRPDLVGLPSDCSCSVEGGGTVVVKDPAGNILQAYRMRPGERLETDES